MCDPLADAANAANAVEAARAHYDDVSGCGRVSKGGSRRARVDDYLVGELAGVLKVGRLLAVPYCDDGSDVGVKPAAELDSDCECDSRLGGTVHPNNNSLGELSSNRRAPGDED